MKIIYYCLHRHDIPVRLRLNTIKAHKRIVLKKIIDIRKELKMIDCALNVF